MNQPGPIHPVFARWGIGVAGFLALCIGAFWLWAWMSGAAPRWSADGVLTVKTNMALGQLLAGVALLTLGLTARNRLLWCVGMLASAVVLSIGFLTLCEHALGWELGIDQMLAREAPGAVATSSPNRMGVPGSGSLLLLGLGMLALGAGRKALATYLGGMVCVITLVPAVGLLYGIHGFYQTAPITGIAWPSVVALIALGAGLILADADSALMQTLWRDDAGGRLLRALLPAALLLPVSVGYLRVLGERAGWYDIETGRGLFVITMTVILSLLLWRCAAGLSETDRRQRLITEALRDSEHRVREREERFRTMANSAPTLVWTSGPDKACTWFNEPWLEFTGRTLEQEIRDGWRANVHPDDLQHCLQVYGDAFDARQSFQAEYRLRRHDGQYRWLLDHGTPVHTPAGQFTGYIGSCLDITDQVLARQSLERQQSLLEEAVMARTIELHESNQRLRLTERLASLGTLSAGLGHDMGNLLVPLRVRLESLSSSALTSAQEEDVAAIRSSAEYLQRLANGLRMLALDPSRAAPGGPTALLAWWADAGPMLKTALPRGISLQSRIVATPDAESWVAISRAALTQVVFNLVQNAGDAMRARGAGTVTVWAEPSGDAVNLGVTDDGPGMPDEVKRHCMEPFFTTKSRSISTGLGLALVHSLVHEAGASVAIQSAPGKGTTFTLSLRAAKSPESVTRNADGKPRCAVVHIDDQRLEAFVVAELRALTFDVRAGNNQREAADLLVTEELNGAALRPGATVILLGGEATTRVEAQVVHLERRPKPHVIRDALRRVASTQAAAK